MLTDKLIVATPHTEEEQLVQELMQNYSIEDLPSLKMTQEQRQAIMLCIPHPHTVALNEKEFALRFWTAIKKFQEQHSKESITHRIAALARYCCEQAGINPKSFPGYDWYIGGALAQGYATLNGTIDILLLLEEYPVDRHGNEWAGGLYIRKMTGYAREIGHEFTITFYSLQSFPPHQKHFSWGDLRRQQWLLKTAWQQYQQQIALTKKAKIQ